MTKEPSPTIEWRRQVKIETDNINRLRKFLKFSRGMSGNLNVKEIVAMSTKALNRARYWQHMLDQYKTKR
jgi:hypothetical protein